MGISAFASAGCSNELTQDPVVLIDARELGVPDTAPPDGYALLTTARTQGLFPSALAVARLEPGATNPARDAAAGGLWSVANLPVVQGDAWNTLLTHVPQVREIIVLDHASMERPQTDIGGVLQAAGRRGAGICLAYGVTAADSEHYSMGGALFDIASREPIAIVRAQAGPADFESRAPERHETDLRHCDVAYLCARKLQAHVRDCLLDLIARDQPATTQPSPWAGSQQFPAEFIILPR